MWVWIGAGYVLFQIAFLLTVLILSKRKDRRYKANIPAATVPAGFVPTAEVQIDPVSGKKTRVYYNAKTGDRLYLEE
nr:MULTISPECIES: hypothetical protein [unclassified Paenibacillus]